MSDNYDVNNSLRKLNSKTLKRNKGSRHLIQKLRFNKGGMIEKINPLVEKKLQNLYNKRVELVKNIVNNRSRDAKVNLDIVNLKIKEYVKNGYRGLRGSTRKIMNKVNNNLQRT
jgi:hypothetical protein